MAGCASRESTLTTWQEEFTSGRKEKISSSDNEPLVGGGRDMAAGPFGIQML